MRNTSTQTRRSPRTAGCRRFTLIELIAVLVIIGIMAAVATPRFGGLVDDVRNRVAVTGVAQAASMLQSGYALAMVQLRSDGSTITADQVLERSLSVGNHDFGDVVVEIDKDGKTIKVTPVSVDGKDVSDAGVATRWFGPLGVGLTKGTVGEFQ